MNRLIRGLYLVIFTDVLCMLLVWFVLRDSVKTRQLAASQKAAAGVTDMKKAIGGLKGELVNAKKDLTNARQQGEKHKAVMEGQDQRIGDLENKVDLVNSENGDLHDKIGRMNTFNGQLAATVKGLRGERDAIKKHFRAGAPVTLMVMADATASMEKLHQDLFTAMSTLFETLPLSSKDFRVGILAFRQGVVDEYPVTQILPAYEDGGKSQQAVLAFIDSLSAQTSNTEHLSVFKRALQLLNKAHPRIEADRKIRMLLLGDVGPSEVDNRTGYSEMERKLKRQIVSGMRTWTKKGDRAMVTLYSESAHSKLDPGANESRQWFEELGSVSPQSKFYTNTNQLLRAVLAASQN